MQKDTTWTGQGLRGMFTVADVYFDQLEADRRREVMERWTARAEKRMEARTAQALAPTRRQERL